MNILYIYDFKLLQIDETLRGFAFEPQDTDFTDNFKG